MLPDAVARELAALLETAPDTVRAAPVAGGCISPAARVEAGGRTVFVKWAGAASPAGLFAAEAASLTRLASARAVRVPRVLAVSGDAIVLEWLEPGRAGAAGWQALGASLARLHRSSASAFGLEHDNFIGPLPQPNAWRPAWPAFFREQRIAPQLARALRTGAFASGDRALLARFTDALDDTLRDAAPDGPSLLHGDLWSGNAYPMRDGEIALIDPASYYGDREVDLAMAELFGGFPGTFFDAYEAAWPTPAGRAQRRAAYQVYYLLVHVNLFGAGYAARTLSAVRAALG